jgi:hypothetical protein
MRIETPTELVAALAGVDGAKRAGADRTPRCLAAHPDKEVHL